MLAMTVPITIMCGFFASDLVHVLLGPKWTATAPIFQLLAPTILIFAMINPLAWLMFALGMVGRSLKVAMVLAPVVMCGYLAGMHYGPKGVAFGYSAVMILWVIPHIAWCVHDTGVTLRDILLTASRPLVSGLAGAVVALVAYQLCYSFLSPLARVVLTGMVLLACVPRHSLLRHGAEGPVLGYLQGISETGAGGEEGLGASMKIELLEECGSTVS